ncbi:hypothetical protein T01_2455 [Trichinella spiralis]|uniref:PiggyBac transposable element-derived protein domain-containing protein n=1 Tax=Trichinella spiralis TaxID=6334 RepID=A0A0V1BLH9_TRISP|nr:hypothetical protein T01_2455 [Trichinella spiralis]
MPYEKKDKRYCGYWRGQHLLDEVIHYGIDKEDTAAAFVKKGTREPRTSRQDSSPYRKEALLRTLTIVNSMIPYNGPYTNKMLKTLAIDNSMIPYNGPYTSKMLKTLAIDNSMIPYNGPYTSKMLKCDKLPIQFGEKLLMVSSSYEDMMDLQSSVITFSELRTAVLVPESNESGMKVLVNAILRIRKNSSRTVNPR